MRLVILVLSVGFLLWPETGVAGTVMITGSGALVFEAAGGEANDVTAELLWEESTASGWSFKVRDAGAALYTGPGCTSVDGHTARCTRVVSPGEHFHSEQVFLYGGDGDDRVSLALLCADCIDGGGPFADIEAHGGPGRDTMIGGRAQIADSHGAFLFGGEGDDSLNGADRDDILVGGPGADVIDGGPAGSTTEGLRASDTVSYEGHHEPIAVDFDGVADDGAAGEGDNVLPTVENAVGGAGDDVLVGDRRENSLRGGAGRDSMFGHGGADWINGGPGADRIGAGAGNDFVAGGLGSDWIHGGPGSDRLDGADNPEEPKAEPHGHDTIFGGAGNDFIQGRGGTDRLYGSLGRDSILGGSGADLLVGGPGRDFLASFAGAHAVHDRVSDRVVGGPDVDEAWVEKRRDVVLGVEKVNPPGPSLSG